MKLFLIDGHALIFKMYYAFLGRPMVNSRREDMSILYGFTKYFLELLSREHPTHVGVCFDPPGGSFRNRLYPEYKANRAETPQLVIDALEPLSALVRAMGVPVIMVSGYEADDTIGTIASRFADEETDVYMVTPDKDYGQLVSEHIFQYKPGKSGSDNEILSPAAICEKWKISSTAQVIDMLAICGDSSDNVPGVSGVGPVGAAKLLSEFGSLEGIYEHIDRLKGRQKENFEAARDHIALSKTLVTIKTDVPVSLTLEELEFKMQCSAELDAMFDRFEFPSLKRMLRKLCSEYPGSPGADASVTENGDRPMASLEFKSVQPSEIRPGRVAVMCRDDKLCVCDADRACAVGSPSDFKALMEDSSTVKAGDSLKEVLKLLSKSGVELNGRLEDLQIMHYLINPELNHSIEELAAKYLGLEFGGNADSARQASLFDMPEEIDPYLAMQQRCCTFLPLADCLKKEMDASGGSLGRLYDEIEQPLLRVLADMELAGVKINLGSLSEFTASLRARCSELENRIREMAGEPSLNIMSPKQIGELLFERMKLDPKARKSKNGSWPTDEQTLLELEDRSPIIHAILDFRAVKKLLSTYIEPFAGYVSALDGRVHTTFNQTITATGRLSSSGPNLQNIPIRTELGREIRRAFVPGEEGWVMMSADYSQIELRLMAHLSGDVHLIQAFNDGRDIHAATAAKIFGLSLDEVTPDMRRIAKTVNFGVMYGMSAFGLSQRLRCSRSEAKKFIDDYFTSFPSIRGFIDSTLDFARANGYVETIFGRRRYIADINSRSASVRAIAERNAVNAPVQGSAADIIKMAMISVSRSLKEKGLRSRMTLQIHDELLLEVPAAEVETIGALLTREMEGVTKLSVPLTVECNYGKNWLDAH